MIRKLRPARDWPEVAGFPRTRLMYVVDARDILDSAFGAWSADWKTRLTYGSKRLHTFRSGEIKSAVVQNLPTTNSLIYAHEADLLRELTRRQMVEEE